MKKNKNAIHQQANTYESLNELEQEKFISRLLSKNISLLNQLKGIVLGMMTIDELTSYKDDERNLSKRIISMLKKRILDSSSEVHAINVT